LLLFAELLVVWLVHQLGAGAATMPNTIAALPYWSVGAPADSAVAGADSLTAISPWLYGIETDGRVTWHPAAKEARWRAQLDRMRAAGLAIMPTIANVFDGSWREDVITRILHDAAARRHHVREIVRLVEREHYQGIDIDYEELRAVDRDVFTAFVTELAAALHERDKLLSVDVFAKTSDRGYDERNRAQDYAAIGAVADQVRIMAYDYHWATSDPGPVAPLPWVRDVLDYATKVIGVGKIVLGIPLYGYDWAQGKGEPVTWLQAYGRSEEFGADVVWDQLNESPHFSYVGDYGIHHELWFENAYSASAKFDLARRFHVGGVFLWMFGPEDHLVWSVLDRHWLGRTGDEVTSG
jgi:spore germination protein YaaH